MKVGNSRWILLLGLLIVPASVSAHLIGGSGLMSGLTHPLFGLDHLLAMVAVGIISTQLGPKMMWLVPGTFVAFMIFGGIMGMAGLGLPLVEIVISLSVLILGVVVSFSKKIDSKYALLAVGLFAFFHGHSHGTEMSSVLSPALYVAGFVFATAALHVFGILAGNYAKKSELSLKVLKYSGVAMGIFGLMLLSGFI